MQRHSFIEMTKLSNVEGRISYITSEKKQEFLYATYDTEDSSFWGELAKCCQAEFKKNGTNGKCIEARELVIALPEEFINIKPDELLEFFVERFREKYDVPCVAALHHNKRKTNLHIHLIFSERRLLDEPVIKTATRKLFYDESGKHVRTKKEILDEDGKVRRGCRIIKKGEVYERILFDKKDIRFKQKGFLNEVKVYLTDQINRLVKTSEEKLKVFDRNSAYLPMKKIGKNNPLEEEIIKDNEARTRWNETVDQAVIAEVPELEIIRVKQEHITTPIKESIEKDGYRPWRFRNIVLMAVRKLEEVIERVVSAARAMKERIDRLMERMERSREKNSAIKTDTDPIIDNVTHPKEENTQEKAYQNDNKPDGLSNSHTELSKPIISTTADSNSRSYADVDDADSDKDRNGEESHPEAYKQSRNEYDREKEFYEKELYKNKEDKEKEKEMLSTSVQTDIKDEEITDTTIVNTVFATHAPKQESDRELDYNTIVQTPETPIISVREEPLITLLALPPIPVKPILSYDYTEMYYLNEQLKQQQDSIFSLQKERNAKEIERDDLGRFNVIKKNKLIGEIDDLEKQIAKKKRELSSALKQHGFETATEFMKVFRELKGQVDGYNRKATEWNEQKRQIEALNQRIVSGEMPIESAMQFVGERGYAAKTVQIKVSELPEDVSIRARIARSRQRADEHNRSRQQRDRDRSSRRAR